MVGFGFAEDDQEDSLDWQGDLTLVLKMDEWIKKRSGESLAT